MGLMIMGLMNGATDRAGAYLVLTQMASYAGELARPPAPGQHSQEVCQDIRLVVQDTGPGFARISPSTGPAPAPA